MLLSLGKNGLTSLLKEVRVFKEIAPKSFRIPTDTKRRSENSSKYSKHPQKMFSPLQLSKRCSPTLRHSFAPPISNTIFHYENFVFQKTRRF